MRKKKSLVSLADLIHDPRKHIGKATKQDHALAISDGGKTVAYVVGAQTFERLEGRALRKFLQSRMKGPTLSNEEVFRRVEETIRRHEKNS
jgi:hypothetical protein